MKRVLKLLARLYPSGWRRRYGAEYEALLDEGTPRVRDVFDVFWGGLKMQMTTWNLARIVLVCSLAGALVAVAISFTRQKTYMSQTSISVDTFDHHSIDTHELAGNVQDLLAQPFLASIIQQENLYPSERARMPENDVVELMKRNIGIHLLQRGDGKPASAFVLLFVYPDPHVAQRVDEELTSRLMALNLRAAINNPSGASRPRVTFTALEAADLPQKPIFPKREVFGAGGLFAGLVAGLVGGLVVAAIAGWRRRLTVSPG